MKKLHFFGLLTLAAALLLGMVFVSCGDKEEGPAKTDVAPDSFKITGLVNGRLAEAIISKSVRAVYGIATGDFYVVRYIDGADISRGIIEWDDPKVTFKPADGGAEFVGYYYGDSLTIVGLGWESEGTIYTGGGTPSTPGSPGTPVTPGTGKTIEEKIEDAIDDLDLALTGATSWADFKAANDSLKDAQTLLGANSADPKYSDLVVAINDAIVAIQDEAIELAKITEFSKGFSSSSAFMYEQSDAPTSGLGDSGQTMNLLFFVASELPANPSASVNPPAGWSYSAGAGNNFDETKGVQTLEITYPVGNNPADAVTYELRFFQVAKYIFAWDDTQYVYVPNATTVVETTANPGGIHYVPGTDYVSLNHPQYDGTDIDKYFNDLPLGTPGQLQDLWGYINDYDWTRHIMSGGTSWSIGVLENGSGFPTKRDTIITGGNNDLEFSMLKIGAVDYDLTNPGDIAALGALNITFTANVVGTSPAELVLNPADSKVYTITITK